MGISFRGVDLHFPRNDLRLSPAFWVAGDCWFGERAGEACRHSLRGAPEIKRAPGNIIASQYVTGKQDTVIHSCLQAKKKPGAVPGKRDNVAVHSHQIADSENQLSVASHDESGHHNHFDAALINKDWLASIYS